MRFTESCKGLFPPSSGGGKANILIYVAMPNKHRAPIFRDLANTLVAGGNQVTVIVEEKIAFYFGESKEVNFLDNRKFIKKYLNCNLQADLQAYCPYVDRSSEGIKSSDIKRRQYLEKFLADNSLDQVIVWSGNFHYQKEVLKVFRENQLHNKLLFCEVGWFSQKEFLYFDKKGVNAFSSISGETYKRLSLNKENRLRSWLDRYSVSRLGENTGIDQSKKIFVPLQVDTDTSIVESSPFKDMKEFISFLESWIPDSYEVFIKLHPKATYDYFPDSKTTRFKIFAGGGIDKYLNECSTVIGVNSTVLLEAAALGKRVVSFGQGLFSGTGVVIEAELDSDPADVLGREVDRFQLESFFYHLIYERQVSLDCLRAGDYSHLSSREPFRELSSAGVIPSTCTFLDDVKEGKAMIKVGNSKVAKTACLDVEHGGEIIIGDNCQIRHHAVLEVSGRYDGKIEIGDHCVVGIGNWLQGSGEIKIASNVIIGPYVAIVSTNHSFDDVETPVAKQPLVPGDVIIEEDVWIGAHCTITQNVKIGKHSIIGANSFVNKNVPPYSIVAGTPAKVIKKRK